MRWHLVDSVTVTVLRSCEASDLVSATTVLRPRVPAQFVVSDASWRVGRVRPFLEEKPESRRGGAGRPRSDAVKAKLSAVMKAVHARKRRSRAPRLRPDGLRGS